MTKVEFGYQQPTIKEQKTRLSALAIDQLKDERNLNIVKGKDETSSNNFYRAVMYFTVKKVNRVS